MIVLSGYLDEAAVPALGAALERGGRMTTIVDLLDVSFFDAAGAAMLSRPNVAVVADRATVRRLAAAGGPEHPHVYASLPEALADAAVA